MGSVTWFCVLSVLVGVSYAMVLEGTENIDDSFEPLVAFKCGFASNYLTRAGWQVDRSRSCLSNVEDIMAYCTLKYPKLQITNVIPSPSEIEANWTSLNGSSLEKSKVRPYRCIVGEFDSDALVVPDDCRYGTSLLANSTECVSYFEWNSTAHERCAAEQSELYSFGVVRPCGVGTFRYMEFVCCPLPSKLPASNVSNANPAVEPSQKSTRPQMQRSTQQPIVSDSNDYSIDYAYEEGQFYDWYEVSTEADMITEDEYEDDPAYQYDLYGEEEETYDHEFEGDSEYEDYDYAVDDDAFDVDVDADDAAVDSIDDNDDDDYDPTKNYFQIYMDAPNLLGNTESDIFAKAVVYVKRYYDGQKQRLMQQLAEAETRVIDAKNASAARLTLADDIETIRRLYDATEKTWNNVQNSMQEEHETRLAVDLQSEREVLREAWMNAVRQLRPNSTVDNLTQLFNALRRYIHSEEKERIFWINRYESRLDTDPEAAQNLRQTVKTALRAIQQRLEAAIESLKRDNVAETVLDSVQAVLLDYLKNYTELDNEVRILFPDLDSATEATTADESTTLTDNEGFNNDLDNADDVFGEKIQFSDEGDARVAQQKPVMLIVLASAGAFVFILVFVSVIVLVCSLRKRRNAHRHNSQPRRHKAALHHALFLVPDATKHGSLEPMHLDSGARRILVDVPPSPRQSVYAQTTHTSDRHVRGHDNPLNNYAGIVFSDSTPLVEHDMLNDDAKHDA